MRRVNVVFFSFGWILISFMGVASPHGYLLDPPQRSSLWRAGFNTTRNYNDNGLNCGGQTVHQTDNNGSCGLCGDAYNIYPRDHEVGGKYYTGIIARYYQMGSDIPVFVRITSYHKGYFEFRLCPEADLSSEEFQACLDRNLLPVGLPGEEKDPRRRFYPVRPNVKSEGYLLYVTLPKGMKCDRCLLQWRYVTGKDWDGTTDAADHQEWFVNCADINIYDGRFPPSTSTSAETPTSTTTAATTTTTRRPALGPRECVPTELYRGTPGMVKWCREVCPLYCPSSHCDCRLP